MAGFAGGRDRSDDATSSGCGSATRTGTPRTWPTGSSRDCTFTDVDLTEATSNGATFTGCRFEHSKLNASHHTATAFVGCEFVRTSLFDAELEGCKLTGSTFVDCTLRPLTVRGGLWRAVGLRAPA